MHVENIQRREGQFQALDPVGIHRDLVAGVEIEDEIRIVGVVKIRCRGPGEHAPRIAGRQNIVGLIFPARILSRQFGGPRPFIIIKGDIG